MHELSLVQSIIETVESDARCKGISKVTRLQIVAGELAPVNHRALSFALENVVKGTMLELTQIDFMIKEARENCTACKLEFKPQPPFYQCPACDKTAYPEAESRTVYIDFYEGE